MFVTGEFPEKSRKSNCSTPVTTWSSMKAILVGLLVALSVYLRRSFLGRTTQRAKSPTKAPAAAMAIILGLLRNRYDPSIRPGCYALFTRMLNDCYMSQAASALGLLSLPEDCHPKKNPAPFSARSQDAEKFVARSFRRAASCEAYLFFRNLRGRTTQATNSKIKAPAAAIAIILPVPP